MSYRTPKKVNDIFEDWWQHLHLIGEKRAVRLIFSLSLLTNLLFIIVRRHFYSVTTWENGQIAENIISGIGFSFSYWGNPTQLTSIMAPFYPYFLASFYFVFGQGPISYILIQLIQAGILAITAVLIYYIGQKIFSQPIGLLSGIAFALYPEYPFITTEIHQLTFNTFCVALIVLCLLRFREHPSTRRAVFLAISLGVSGLIFPAALFYSPLIALWIVVDLRDSHGLKKSIGLVGLIAIISFLIISPWSVRNYIVHDKFMLVKAWGWNFWRGNYPPGIYIGMPNALASLPNHIQQELLTMSEVEGNTLLREMTFQWIASHPTVWLEGVAKKMMYFWYYPHELYINQFVKPSRSSSTISPTIYALRKVGYTPVLILGVVGIVVGGLRDKDVMPLFLLFIAFTIEYGLFYVRPVYRIPTIQPYIIIFAVYSCYLLGARYLE